LRSAFTGGDPEQEYFADGIVEEITTALSRLRWLFVIARNSSFTYKGRAVDVKQVGRELGCATWSKAASARRVGRAPQRSAFLSSLTAKTRIDEGPTIRFGILGGDAAGTHGLIPGGGDLRLHVVNS
jgi:hypothetical protein